MAQKADVEQQAAWKKAFGEALRAEGLKRRDIMIFVDELRWGLLGQVWRRWGVRGVKMRQQVELRYEWRYLLLAVDPMTRRLWWAWLERVRGKEVAQVVEKWGESGVKGVVWDNAAFHRARAVGEVGLKRIYQPPYSPEVNPVERVFEEIRRHVEGRVYGSIEAKRAAVEEVLRRLETEGRLSTLVGWAYIQQAFQALPK